MAAGICRSHQSAVGKTSKDTSFPDAMTHPFAEMVNHSTYNIMAQKVP